MFFVLYWKDEGIIEKFDNFWKKNEKFSLVFSEILIIFLISVSSVSFAICEEYFESSSSPYIYTIIIITLTAIAFLTNIVYYVYKERKSGKEKLLKELKKLAKDKKNDYRYSNFIGGKDSIKCEEGKTSAIVEGKVVCYQEKTD